jgi:hypothetical protein
MIGKKVRCIDVAGNKTILTIGFIYTVSFDEDDFFILKECGDTTFFKRRFQALTDAEAMSCDPEEIRLRAKFIAPRSGHCMCGIFRRECVYHR